MQAGIRTYLLADANIAAAVTGVYGFPVPQGTAMPYLVLSRIDGSVENLIGETLDINAETWQVDVYASTMKAAETIKVLVVARLNIADRVEMGSYTVYSCSLSGVTDTTELENDGGESAVCRISLSFDMRRNNEITT